MARHKGSANRGLTLTYLILEKLAEVGEATLGSFFPAKYPQARLWRTFLGFDAGYQFRRETFAALLSRLRAQGLVARLARKGRWRITARGRKTLMLRDARLPKTDGLRRLVIFDIPEKERKKRGAVRVALANNGFRQLQKSVWYGERPLPEDFVALLDILNLKRYIHIFSVRDAGTLPLNFSEDS